MWFWFVPGGRLRGSELAAALDWEHGSLSNKNCEGSATSDEDHPRCAHRPNRQSWHHEVSLAQCRACSRPLLTNPGEQGFTGSVHLSMDRVAGCDLHHGCHVPMSLPTAFLRVACSGSCHGGAPGRTCARRGVRLTSTSCACSMEAAAWVPAPMRLAGPARCCLATIAALVMAFVAPLTSFLQCMHAIGNHDAVARSGNL